MSGDETRFSTRIIRKREDLLRYVVVKSEHVSGRTEAFAADVMLDDVGPFERNVRLWGKGSDVFFFNLTAPQCARADLDNDDVCVVTIVPKS